MPLFNLEEIAQRHLYRHISRCAEGVGLRCRIYVAEAVVVAALD